MKIVRVFFSLANKHLFLYCLGATQSTLQDIKVAEKAGGYYYKDKTKVQNRNRFIYWLVLF